MLPQCQWSGIAFNNKTLPQKFTTPQIHRQNLTAIQPRSFNLVSLPNPPIIEVQVGWANWPGQSLNNFNETFTRSSLALNMNRKLPLNQKFAIHGKIMAKNGHFSWNFQLFSAFFKYCSHSNVPNGKLWGSTSTTQKNHFCLKWSKRVQRASGWLVWLVNFGTAGWGQLKTLFK